jgi:transcriptional regulator with XRE-family HTH domain
MTERPAPPPWGALITAALASEGISAREAARRAGLSEGRWRQISGGYKVVSPGIYAEVRGPARTLARMAAVAGVTPAQLRASGRDDAAQILASERDRRPAGEEMIERVKAMDTDQARELLATIAQQLGISLPGAAEARGDESERRYGT